MRISKATNKQYATWKRTRPSAAVRLIERAIIDRTADGITFDMDHPAYTDATRIIEDARRGVFRPTHQALRPSGPTTSHACPYAVPGCCGQPAACPVLGTCNQNWRHSADCPTRQQMEVATDHETPTEVV
ncbi:MAG: hypothetical protein JXM70_14070 [Pirellulales bacterium]|nr:hypothetical protein [Pirellulales bacterium]